MSYLYIITWNGILAVGKGSFFFLSFESRAVSLEVYMAYSQPSFFFRSKKAQK